MGELIKIVGCLLADAFRFVALLFCSTKSLRAETCGAQKLDQCEIDQISGLG
jgi:hypothetical protein